MSSSDTKIAYNKQNFDLGDVEESWVIAVWEANEFLRAFAQRGWPDHWDSFSIHCNLSLDELQSIGSLERTEGIRACQRIVCVPVISEEVGTALWEHLATATSPLSSQPHDDEQVLFGPSLSFSVSTDSTYPFCTAASGRGRTLFTKGLAEGLKRQRKKPKRRLQHRCAKHAAHSSCAFCSGNCSYHDNHNRPVLQMPVLTRLKSFVRPPDAMVKSRGGVGFWQVPEIPTTAYMVASNSDYGDSSLLSRLRSRLVKSLFRSLGGYRKALGPGMAR